MTKLGEIRRRVVTRIPTGPAAPQAPPAPALEPSFFGPDQALFGCYDRPSPTRGTSGTGVLICAPLGHEYTSAHRALRQLALRIADAGFVTLRFDYYGTGDSAGSSDEVSLPRCRQDIESAIDELRGRTGCSRVALIGYRAGATLAASVAARRDDLAGLMLWDPVVSGKRHLEALRAAHEQWARGHASPPHVGDDELLGVSFTKALLEQIEKLELAPGPGALAPRVLVLETSDDEAVSGVVDRMAEQGVDVSFSRFDVGIELDDPERVHVPRELVEVIVRWVEGG